MSITRIDRLPPVIERPTAQGTTVQELIYYQVNGVLRDFTGWTATANVVSNPGGQIVAAAIVTLNNVGEITFELTDMQTAKMRGKYIARILATDGTDTDALVDIHLIVSPT